MKYAEQYKKLLKLRKVEFMKKAKSFIAYCLTASITKNVSINVRSFTVEGKEGESDFHCSNIDVRIGDYHGIVEDKTIRLIPYDEEMLYLESSLEFYDEQEAKITFLRQKIKDYK